MLVPPSLFGGPGPTCATPEWARVGGESVPLVLCQHPMDRCAPPGPGSFPEIAPGLWIEHVCERPRTGLCAEAEFAIMERARQLRVGLHQRTRPVSELIEGTHSFLCFGKSGPLVVPR